MFWYERSWAEAEAALDARLKSEILDFSQIAELHAVHMLGASFPEMNGLTPTAGYDVLWNGLRIEVKSKKPSDHSRANLYIAPQLSKRDGSDRFWFYIFAREAVGLEVWEAETKAVFANLSVRKGTAITLTGIEKIGRRIWREGRDCRSGAWR